MSSESPIKPSNAINASIFESRKYENEERIYSKHILLANTSVSSEPQIQHILEQLFSQADRLHLKPHLEKKWKINVVRKFGYSYIWIKDERFFNLILGRNADGSERMETVQLPYTEEIEDEQFYIDSGRILVDRNGNRRQWSEVEEEIFYFEQEKSEFVVKQPMASLLKTPSIHFSKEQEEELVALLKQQQKPPVRTQEFMIDFSCAHISHDLKKAIIKELWCENVPEWILRNQGVWETKLKDSFVNYVKNPNAVFGKRIDGVDIKGTYPHVLFRQWNGRMICIVVFEKSQDARWALTMNKVLQVSDPKSKLNATLYFKLSERNYCH